MKKLTGILRIAVAAVFVWPMFVFAFLGVIFYYIFSLFSLRKTGQKVAFFFYTIVCWWMLVFLGARVHVEGRENIPSDGKGFIFAPNHNSMCDIALFYLGAGRFPAMMAKAEVFRLPLLHGMLRSLECIKIGRHSAHGVVEAIRASVKHIEEGKSLVIFPEGTRSKTGVIGTFKSGAFKVAERTHCSIVPVAIKNDRYLLESACRFGIIPVYISFLPPIDTSALSDEERNDLGPIVENAVREKWNSLPSWPVKK